MFEFNQIGHMLSADHDDVTLKGAASMKAYGRAFLLSGTNKLTIMGYLYT